MENRKNLCAMIPETLHNQARTEQEKLALTLSQYVEMVLKEHFEKGEKAMDGKTRTLAFQVTEELFGRIKEHLKRTGLSQKDFVIGLIEQALTAVEAEGGSDEAETDETRADEIGTEEGGSDEAEEEETDTGETEERE